MFDAPNCWCCGKKEDKNGYGCNNPKCKEYYKLKGAKNIEEDISILQEIRKAEEKIEKEQAENEKAVFKEIRKLVSAYKVRKLREYMSETAYWDLKIVYFHGAVKPQDEPYWFKQAYVSQSCGYSGDDYSGMIWIPLPNGNYLEYSFSC